MKLIRPPALEKGDTIGIIAPSSGLSALFPHRLNKAIKFLNKSGYKTKIFQTAKSIHGQSSATPKMRAKDIHLAFEDAAVKAIICTIGGETSAQTLKFLDFRKIEANPKIFIGYSDISVLHYAFYTQSHLTTFYGPAALTQFGEHPKPLKYTFEHFEAAISHKSPIGQILPSSKWTEEVLDWSKKLDLKRARKLTPNKGYEWIRQGRAIGNIIGGCLPSIMRLKSSKFWPNHKSTIFFLDLPEGNTIHEGESLSRVNLFLAELRRQGLFKEIKGLIIGRPYHYGPLQVKKFHKLLLDYTEKNPIPILYGADIGHTDPIITIPLGVKTEINSSSNSFKFLEAGISKAE